MLTCGGGGASLTINVPVVYMGRDVWIWMDPNPDVQPQIKKQVILWTRDFRAHSGMVSNKFWMGGGRVGTLRGRIKGGKG